MPFADSSRFLADASAGAEEAHRAWQQRVPRWQVQGPGSDWRAKLLPALDAAPYFVIWVLQPLHLIGSCDVFHQPDGADSGLRDRWTFMMGGTACGEPPSIFLARTRGFLSKTVETRYLDPTDYDGCTLDVLSEHGAVRVEAQLHRRGVPRVRLGWWSRERGRSDTMRAGETFIDAFEGARRASSAALLPMEGLPQPVRIPADMDRRGHFDPDLLTGLRVLGRSLCGSSSPPGTGAPDLERALRSLVIATDHINHAWFIDELCDHLERTGEPEPWVWIGAARFVELRCERRMTATGMHDRLLWGAKERFRVLDPDPAWRPPRVLTPRERYIFDG